MVVRCILKILSLWVTFRHHWACGVEPRTTIIESFSCMLFLWQYNNSARQSRYFINFIIKYLDLQPRNHRFSSVTDGVDVAMLGVKWCFHFRVFLFIFIHPMVWIKVWKASFASTSDNLWKLCPVCKKIVYIIYLEICSVCVEIKFQYFSIL